MEHYGQSVRLLMTIPGFSALTSIALLSDIGDIERFPTVKSFCCYLRTTPSLHASNRTIHLGAINKTSRSLTVTLLTQSAQHLKKATPYFSVFYDRLRSGKGFGKTKIALIHKILVCAYYILKRQQPFRYETKVSYAWKTYRLMRELNLTPVVCEFGECPRA
jgi:transposase